MPGPGGRRGCFGRRDFVQAREVPERRPDTAAHCPAFPRRNAVLAAGSPYACTKSRISTRI